MYSLIIRLVHLHLTLTSPFRLGIPPISPFPVLPGVKKLVTGAAGAVDREVRAVVELPAWILLAILQIVLVQLLLPPPRLFFLRLAPRFASVGLIFLGLSQTALRLQNVRFLGWMPDCRSEDINKGDRCCDDKITAPPNITRLLATTVEIPIWPSQQELAARDCVLGVCCRRAACWEM